MAVTERLSGSGMLTCVLEIASVMKKIFVVMVLAFAFTTGMAVTTIVCADRVMRDLLMFLGRGFALFAGGPAVLYAYPPSRRSAAIVTMREQERVGGSAQW